MGIVGANFAATVHAPAFQSDCRCELAAVAASRAESAARAAAHLGDIKVHDTWERLIEDPTIDAVAIAVPPAFQAEIALAAIDRGKAVFAEKPLALTPTLAGRMCEAAGRAGIANMVDFGFVGLPAWIEAKRRIQGDEIGRLRQIVVNWSVETRVNALRLSGWKVQRTLGGGTLFNFVSHVLHYLEWFSGPLAGMVVRLFPSDGDIPESDTFVVMTAAFQSGAAASASISTAAFMGNGHRLEFYGEKGSIVLANSTPDYMRGFVLTQALRAEGAWRQIEIHDPLDKPEWDGRVSAVCRLATRFLDWVSGGAPARPDFADGLRVQQLLDVAQQSHLSAHWVELT